MYVDHLCRDVRFLSFLVRDMRNGIRKEMCLTCASVCIELHLSANTTIKQEDSRRHFQHGTLAHELNSYQNKNMYETHETKNMPQETPNNSQILLVPLLTASCFRLRVKHSRARCRTQNKDFAHQSPCWEWKGLFLE